MRSLVSLLLAAASLLITPTTHAQQELQGWVNVPGGTVWLRPDVDAYEHNTGLVRDMRTGHKYHPVTPQQVQVAQQPYAYPAAPAVSNCGPCQPQVVAPQIVIRPQAAPVVRPQVPQYLPNPYYAPFTPQVIPAKPTRNSSRYDYGPYGTMPPSNYGLEVRPSRSSLSREFSTLPRF